MNIYSQMDSYGQVKVIDQLDKIFYAHTVTYTQHITDYCTVDINMNITKGDTQLIYNLEAKDRTYTHNRFNEWYLQVDKYEELIKRGNAYYVNTFKDNWLVVWNLSQMDMSQVRMGKEYLWHSTVEKDYKMWKPVYYLPLSKAVYSSAFI